METPFRKVWSWNNLYQGTQEYGSRFPWQTDNKEGNIVDDMEAILSFVPQNEEIFLVQLQLIQSTQGKDRSLRKRLKDNRTNYKKQIIENVQLVTYKDRIFIPETLRNQVLTWYHYYLCHPGKGRVYNTMAATLYWDKMEADITAFTKGCSTWQRFKKKKYGKLSPKDTTMVPWETVCIDLTGPYTGTEKLGNDRIFNVMTFVDPVTGWFEITKILDKTRQDKNQNQPNL